MSQAAFNGAFQFDPNGLPRKAAKKKLRKRQHVMERAIEALEPRQMLSVSGFQPAVNYAAAAGPKAVATGDFNHDGKLDLVTVNQTANSVSVLLGTGTGTFASARNSTTGTGTGPRGVVTGDFNGDGKLDVAVANQSNGTISILTGKGDGTFNAPVSYAVGTQPVALVAGDFNGDGKTDLAVADFGDVRVLTNRGDGTFNAAVSYTVGTSPNGIVLADFNGDGKLDLGVTNGGGGVSILTGAGDGTFHAAYSVAAGANLKGLTAADFNGDSFPDLAVVNGTAGTVSILTNDGTGHFGAPVPLAVGASPVAVTAADFNGDGNVDLAVVNNGGASVSILPGNGTGTFGAPVSKATGTSPVAAATGDFNGDGEPDLAVANSAASSVSVLLDKHITATGTAQQTVAGTALSGVTVATFTDTEAGTVNGDYAATIDWGDGTAPSAGTITSSGGVFSVAASHDYTTQGVYTVTTTVRDTLGTTAITTGSAEVDDAAINASGTVSPIVATEGTSFTGTVGTFTSVNPYAQASDFLVAVDFGDGYSGTGTVVSDGGGAFHVVATHDWRHAASRVLTIDVQDSGGEESTASSAVTVNDAPISAVASTLAFVEGTSATQTVAVLTDSNRYGSANEYTATIDWGDGTQSAGTIVATATRSVFNVVGTHSYDHAGGKVLAVTINSVAGSTTSAAPSATVANAALAATGEPVSATEGVSTGSVVVGHFTDANAAASAGDFTASVNWGDGSSADVGTVSWNAVTSQFDVTAPAHTFDHAGSTTITLTVAGAGGGTAQASSTAAIANGVIAVTAAGVASTEGTSTGSVLLGTFTDTNPAATAADFTASVYWGDTAVLDHNTTITWNSAAQDFEVRGGHTYAHAGPATMTLTVTGAGGTSVTDQFANVVANAPISVTAAAVSATEGSSFSGKVASFTSGNVFAHGPIYYGDFTASIDWGDGTAPTTGVVAWNAAASRFDVTGTHTWHHDGSDSVIVTITGLGGGTASDSAAATIADAPLHSTGETVASVEGVSTGSVLVATFTDENPYGQLGDYSAVVNWGDFSGDDSNTSIAFNSQTNQYEVYASHTYAHASHNEGNVTITDGDGSTTVAVLDSDPQYAPITLTPGTITATEGQSATNTVATFTSPNPQADGDYFSAQITWATGGAPTQGTVTWNSNTNEFDVAGTHTYNHAGAKVASIVISGAYGTLASTTVSATVANAPLAVTANAITGATEGAAIAPFVVAHFTDANAAAAAGDFTSVIDWGDGSPTTTNASIVANANGGFDVVAGHTYAHAGPETVTVTVNGLGGGSQSDAHTSTIGNAALAATANGFTVQEAAPTGSQVIASFTDANAAAVAGDFTATVAWGDSASDPATIAWNAVTSQFDVTAPTHTYDHAGPKSVVVTVNGLGGGVATATATATVTNAAITVAHTNPSPTEGIELTNAVVATFTSANPNASASDFTADINWGEFGAHSVGVITESNGVFSVTGTHTYPDAGNVNLTVTVTGAGGGTGSDFAGIHIANQPLTATGATVAATEGHAFANQVIGTFSDPNALATADVFGVSIDWGDGSPADQTGSIVATGGGHFNIVAGHTYADTGAKTVSYTITGNGGGQAIGTSTVNVADAALSSTGGTDTATEGTLATGLTVAHFTDANPDGVPSTYTATINWGDGSSTSSGTITADGHGGYTVTGDHLYAAAGTFTISTLIGDDGTSTTTAISTATVSHGVISAIAVPVTATEGVALDPTTPLATFTDTNQSATAGDFTATVTWGAHGTPVAATVVGDGNGGFIVEGGFTYAHAGAKAITVVITGLGGSATVNPTATVHNAALTVAANATQAAAGVSFSGVVGSFTDANALAGAADFTATINWGDGTAPTVGATIAWNSTTQQFDVSAAHLYHTPGSYTLTLGVSGQGGGSASNANTVTVQDGVITPSADTVHAVEGAAFTGELGTFTDSDPEIAAGVFAASIDWGDGSPAGVGTVVLNGNGTFSVRGTHTWTTAGTPNITISLVDTYGGTATIHSSAVVADAPLASTGVAVSAVEGVAQNAVQVMHLTDGNPFGAAGDYTVNINWGDSTTSSGWAVANPNGGFDVYGAHTYAHAGSSTISVTASDAGGSSTTATATATIANAALGITAGSVSGVEGSPLSATVATFTDANLAASAGDFGATINWGDGTAPTAGVISADGNGGFNVVGGHTYQHAGSKTITVTVNGNGGGTVSQQVTAGVANATLSATGRAATTTEGQSRPLTLAHFTDANPGATAADFTASIDWTDGVAHDPATVVANAQGGFDVVASHAYQHAGTVSPVVTILGAGSGVANATASVLVANAALAGTGSTLTATEGQPLPAATVIAHFTDANGGAAAADFQATVTWGSSNTPLPTTIVANLNGGFDVLAGREFDHAGNKTFAVAVTGNGGGSISLNGAAHVANDILTATPVAVSATEGTALPGTTVFARFTDANAFAAALDFSATIDFGDGQSGAGSVVADPNGGFDVVAAHTFGHAGNDTATVHVAGNGGGTAQAASSVHVANAGLSIAGGSINAVEGIALGSGVIGHFVDANAAAAANDFAVSVDWGDGSATTNASVVANAGGGFDVVANHTFAHAGPETYTLSLTGAGGGTATGTGTALVANAALASTGKAINAVEGVALADSTAIAHFTDANAAASSDDFIAVIHWADNSSSAGTIVANANGGFDVLGGHTYSHAGSRNVTVDISGNGAGTTSATSTLHVANAALSATGQAASTTEGATTSFTLAHFTDANAAAAVGDFTATITWGDGSAAEAATIVANPNGGFDVTGSHAYVHAGSRTAAISISGYGGGSASAVASVTVGNALLNASGKTLTSVEGSTFNGAVATFTDANAGASATDFTATIAWGDSATTTAGVITALDGGGFAVSGSHLYAHQGSQAPVITITGAGGQTVTANSTMAVADAPFLFASAPVTTLEGVALSNVVVGTINDANTSGAASNFTATINWGDGSAATPATLVRTAPGVYSIKGTHTYEVTGQLTTTITVTSDGGSVQTSTDTATVSAAAITATGTSISSTAGQTFTGKVAHFTSANGAAPATNFTASINWADGTTTAGTIVAASGGGFDVTGSHAWHVGGTKAVSVSIAGGDSTPATASTTATVAAVTPVLAGINIKGTRGVSITAAVASFTTTNALAVAGDFTATILWGDGVATIATITPRTGGGFNVVGTHTFTTAGTTTGKVTLYTPEGGRLFVASSMAIAKPVASIPGAVGSGQDSDPADSAHTRHVKHVAHVNHVAEIERHQA